MKCMVCGATMSSQRENYHYTACGLPHVTLHQVEVSRCSVCGETEVAIPVIEGLHRSIAHALVRKPARLAPDEIRYLRKYLGWSGVDFAARMGVTPETVSRWEHGKEAMGAVADRLLRALVVLETPVQDYSADLFATIADTMPTRVLQFGLSRDHETWQEAELAGV